MDGQELLRIANAVANTELRRRGAYLGDRHADLIGFLVVVGCKAAATYDSSWPRARYGLNGGDPFRSYIGDIMQRRLYDFYRSRGEGFSDRRYLSHAEVTPTADEALALLAAGATAAVDVSEHALETAAAELGEGLSEEARDTLERIALPAAQGYNPMEIARAAGVGVAAQKQRLAALREELEAVTASRGGW
jgi:DNA-directed RNA polymerase specialized sigma24 family protein